MFKTRWCPIVLAWRCCLAVGRSFRPGHGACRPGRGQLDGRTGCHAAAGAAQRDPVERVFGARVAVARRHAGARVPYRVEPGLRNRLERPEHSRPAAAAGLLLSALPVGRGGDGALAQAGRGRGLGPGDPDRRTCARLLWRGLSAGTDAVRRASGADPMSVDSRAFRLALLTSAAAALTACGGGGSTSASSSPPPPPPTANVAAMIVDGGPVVNGMPIGTINQAYVTITVCIPGTSTCQNIDHVWVDTGSAGLRLITSAFTSQLPATMQATDTVANCVQFVNSYSWGAVRTADVKIAGESASSVPIQVIGDAAVPATAPGSCGSMNPLNTAAPLGANSLLGLGVFRHDCGPGCTTVDPVTMQAPAGFYYTCPAPANTCNPVTMPLDQQLHSP